MTDVLNSPVFGILLAICTYEIGLIVYRKTKLSIFNPLLISISLIIMLLVLANIPLTQFNKGGDYISFFLEPATVILAVPLYKQLPLLKKNLIPILSGIFTGSLTSIIGVLIFSKLMHLNRAITYSLIPKSITTPVGIEITKEIGGIPSITIIAIIFTGILGSIIGPAICKLFKIHDKIAFGTAMGTASHAIGTSRALEIGEIEGAISGMSIGIAALITVLIVPIILKLINL